MKRYHLTNTVTVDANREHELLSNGERGARRVVLCCAPSHNEWRFYLRTNGGPVLLTDSNAAEWLDTLGAEPEDVIGVIAAAPADAISCEWAIEQIQAVA